MKKAPGLRVLICEDSRTYAGALRRMLEHDGAISVVGVCSSAEEAIAALPALNPNLVTMDLELPGMSGLEAVEEIMSVRPVPILVLSAHVRSANENAAAALAAGALEAVAKDDLDLLEPDSVAGAAFRRRVQLLSRAHVIRHPRARLSGRSGNGPGRRASVIGVVASTGGPQILARVLEALPADYAIPLLVVQHIAAGFTDGLAHWLDRTVPLPVQVAAAGIHLDRGVWIAPEGAHLRLEVSGTLSFDRRTGAGLHRPSGDVLLESVADAAGSTGVAVILSGMGQDGADGAAAVKRRGGLAIAQDECSSAVYGMPRAAVQRGVDVVLTPAEIVTCLRTLHHAPLVETA